MVSLLVVLILLTVFLAHIILVIFLSEFDRVAFWSHRGRRFIANSAHAGRFDGVLDAVVSSIGLERPRVNSAGENGLRLILIVVQLLVARHTAVLRVVHFIGVTENRRLVEAIQFSICEV